MMDIFLYRKKYLETSNITQLLRYDFTCIPTDHLNLNIVLYIIRHVERVTLCKMSSRINNWLHQCSSDRLYT